MLWGNKSAAQPATVKKIKRKNGKGQKNGPILFGFVTLTTGEDVFFHKKDLDRAGIADINEGDKVRVTPEPSTKKEASCKLQAATISL